ncbi:MAG: hypothetical protein EB116_17670 [Betaproteobacteria bacterium]|nr:hypothetical protein [Betaproteobacteria bacterium]
MLINWTFFDYFLSKRKNINKSLPFYKSSCFWTAAVGSNFMCAAIDSIQFSIGVESIPPQFNQLGAIVALCFLFSFFAITLRNDEKLLRLFAFIFGMALFIYVWRSMINIWVDPFAYKLASFLCSCKPDENLAWIVDIESTSLFKVITPTFAWWILHFYNKKTGVLQRG